MAKGRTVQKTCCVCERAEDHTLNERKKTGVRRVLRRTRGRRRQRGSVRPMAIVPTVTIVLFILGAVALIYAFGRKW